MKLLVLSYEFPPLGGGGAKVVKGLIDSYLAAGHSVDLVTMHFSGLARFEQHERLRIFRVATLRTNQSVCYFPEMLPYLFSALAMIRKLVKQNDYDANHTHFIFPDGIVAWLSKKWFGLDYVITAHGSDVPGYNPDRFKLLHCLLRPVWRWVTAGANKIICPSEHIGALINQQNPGAQTVRIPNGIDTEKFWPKQPKRPAVLVVTRMFKRKGVQYLLHALRNIDRRLEVNIVGEGPHLESIKRAALSLEHDICFHGYLDNHSDELKALYERSLIFVLTSESENFPIVLLEAMTAGLAIITTANTGCAEVVGDCARLVPAKDPEAIQRALLEILADPALQRSLSSKARARVERHFAWPTVVDQHVKLICQGL